MYYWWPKYPKATLRKRNIARAITMPGFSLNYRAPATNTAWYWHKNNHGANLNIQKQTQACMANHQQKCKNTYWRKGSLLLCWENQTSTCRRLKLESSLSPYLEIHSQQIKSLEPFHCQQKTRQDIGTGNDYTLPQQLRKD